MRILYPPFRLGNVIVFYGSKYDNHGITSITLILTSILTNLFFFSYRRDINLYYLEFHIYVTQIYKMTLYNKLL